MQSPRAVQGWPVVFSSLLVDSIVRRTPADLAETEVAITGPIAALAAADTAGCPVRAPDSCRTRS